MVVNTLEIATEHPITLLKGREARGVYLITAGTTSRQRSFTVNGANMHVKCKPFFGSDLVNPQKHVCFREAT